jgi:dihydrofolate reductase
VKISIVAGIGNSKELGLENKLLWRLPEDLKSFKALTLGKSMVMGRKTYESIGRPLPGRETIILTRDKSYHQEGCTVLHSEQEILKHANGKNLDELVIVGGGEIYKLFLSTATEMYISHVNFDGKADTFFPDFNEDEWTNEIISSFKETEKTLSWELLKYTRKL